MSAKEMVELVEEMIEIKVRHHAAMTAKTTVPGNRELARAISQMNVADRDRLQFIKSVMIQTLEGG